MNAQLGKNLKFLRSKNGLSQEQFAMEIGLNRGNIASYEKGTAEPNVNNLLKIVKYFNIDLIDLIEKDLSSGTLSVDILQGEDLAANVLIEELEGHSYKMEKFLHQSNDMQKIMEGFRTLHQFKKNRGKINLEKMSQEYESLLEVMESLLSSHQELIQFLVRKEKLSGV